MRHTLGAYRGFRLIGLVAQGSIPWAGAALIALPMAVIVRLVRLNLSIHSGWRREAMPMRSLYRARLLVLSILDTMWGIGASTVAGALPA